jgi:hypothetical protein
MLYCPYCGRPALVPQAELCEHAAVVQDNTDTPRLGRYQHLPAEVDRLVDLGSRFAQLIRYQDHYTVRHLHWNVRDTKTVALCEGDVEVAFGVFAKDPVALVQTLVRDSEEDFDGDPLAKALPYLPRADGSDEGHGFDVPDEVDYRYRPAE